MKLALYHSHLTHANGYGFMESTQALLAALRLTGCSLCLYPDLPHTPLPGGWDRFDSGRTPECWLASTARHEQTPLMPTGWRILRTMFEAGPIHPLWLRRFGQYDDLWVPGPHSRDLLIQGGIPQEKIFVVPEVLSHRPSFRDERPRDRVRFLSILDGRVWYRKGLDLLLHAWQMAFRGDEPVELVLKTNLSLEELLRGMGWPRPLRGAPIRVLSGHMEADAIQELYATADALVLPSRGEGAGRPLLDALLAGVPVVTTRATGQADLLPEEGVVFCEPVRLVSTRNIRQVRYPFYPQAQWAEADVRDIVDALRLVANRPGELRAAARVGSDWLWSRYAPETVATLLSGRLGRTLEVPSREAVPTRDHFLALNPQALRQDRAGSWLSGRPKRLLIYGAGEAARRARMHLEAWLVAGTRMDQTDRVPLTTPLSGVRAVDLTRARGESYDLTLLAVHSDYLIPVLDRLRPWTGALYWYYPQREGR